MRVARAVDAPSDWWGRVSDRAAPRLRAIGQEPVAVRARELLARRHAVIAIVVYLTGAVVMQRHAMAHIGTEMAGNIVGDPTAYMWSMWWWPHAILHVINPFVTHAMWVPDAYNLGSVASTPLPSLLFAPLNAVLGWVQGPVVSYNLCNLIAPILGAWFAYRLCLYLSGAPAASIIGGWLYGFSAYGLSQLQGHMNLVFTFLPPVLLLLSLRRMDGVISRQRYIVLAAAAIAAQIGIGTEILFTSTCMAVTTIVVALILAPLATRIRILSILPSLLGAYALAAVVCAPYLYYQLTGPAVNASANSVLKVADLLSFVIPTPIIRLGANRFAALSGDFPAVAGYLETGTYLGLPIIFGALAFAIETWRNWATKVLVIVTLVAVIGALGPSLTIDGHATIPLPWKLLEHVRPFDEVTSVRIGMYVALGTAIAFALWLAKPDRPSVPRWLVALLAVAFLFPNVNGMYPTGQKIFQENLRSPSFIADALYRRYLPRNTVILPIPFGPFGNSLLWQAQAQGYFRLASGWFGYWPPDYSTSMLVGQLSGFHAFTDPVSLMRSFLVGHRVGSVVMVAGQAGLWPKVMSQLGLARIATGGIWLYDVPKTLTGSAS